MIRPGTPSWDGRFRETYPKASDPRVLIREIGLDRMGAVFAPNKTPEPARARSLLPATAWVLLCLVATANPAGSAKTGSNLSIVTPPAQGFKADDGRDAPKVTVASLLREMTDLEALASRPVPWFKQAAATSYSRESHKGAEAWFDNRDVGQHVRTETNSGRKEHVLADLRGPGTVSRFWSANPDLDAPVRFYFDGETEPRLVMTLPELFLGKSGLFPPAFSYISGTGGTSTSRFPTPRRSRSRSRKKKNPFGFITRSVTGPMRPAPRSRRSTRRAKANGARSSIKPPKRYPILGTP